MENKENNKKFTAKDIKKKYYQMTPEEEKDFQNWCKQNKIKVQLESVYTKDNKLSPIQKLMKIKKELIEE